MPDYSGSVNFISTLQCLVSTDWISAAGKTLDMERLGELNKCNITIRQVKELAKSLQSCPTLCDPGDCSLPGSSIHGIFQTRVLEWGAITFSVPAASRGQWKVLLDEYRISFWDCKRYGDEQ